MENFEFRLPEDLVLNILLRLPFICFLRFRCVSKSWYSILSDLIFMYKNLTFINFDDDNHLQLLLKQCHYIDDTLHKEFSLISFHNLHLKRYLSFTYESVGHLQSFFRKDRDISIVGSYNGLVCLTDHYADILVWNPLTEEVKVVPKSPNFTDAEWFVEEFSFVPFEVGFCFEAITDDYKVIKIFHLDEHYDMWPNAVFLYSFKSEIWKKLDFSLRLFAIPGAMDPMICTPISTDEKFHHWIADPPIFSDDNFSRVLVSFDMNNERIETTEIPYILNYSGKCGNLSMGFFMLKNFVAVYFTPEAGSQIIEISVLLRIGMKESWTKLLRIGPLEDVQKILLPWKNGSLIFQTSKGDVMVFDPCTREIVLIPTNERSPPYYTQLLTYKEAHVQ